MHLLVASIFIMVNASHTIATPTPSAELSRNTTSVVMCDTTRALELRTFDPPVPALGTVESAVVVSFAMTLGALPPMIRFVLAASGVLFTTLSQRKGSMPWLLHQVCGKIW